MIFTQVDPEALTQSEPDTYTGRGAWTRRGIGFNYRYALAPDPRERIGVNAEASLDHWAVAAGCYAIQARLVALGYLATVKDTEKGIFGPRTDAAVRHFQEDSVDVRSGKPLTVDGVVGTSDARALFTPVIAAAERKYRIPRSLLLGQTAHESMLDPGCVGYYIYYPDYRGVDRGMSQINSRWNPQVTWEQSYDPIFAADWSARRLRDFFTKYSRDYPRRRPAVMWDAAVCAHNNPTAAGAWAREGKAPHEQAAKYVAAVKEAAK